MAQKLAGKISVQLASNVPVLPLFWQSLKLSGEQGVLLAIRFCLDNLQVVPAGSQSAGAAACCYASSLVLVQPFAHRPRKKRFTKGAQRVIQQSTYAPFVSEGRSSWPKANVEETTDLVRAYE